MSIAGYPPANHILGDLGIEAEVTSLTEASVRIPVSPHLTGPDGGVRAGVLATLVDVVGGAVAIRSVLPDWMATADLTLQLVGPAVGPFVEARATMVRRGRTTLVVEALVVNTDGHGADAGFEASGPDWPSDEVVAWATMTFTILPGRSATRSLAVPEEPPVRWVFDGGHLDRPVVEALSVKVVDAEAGVVSLPVHPYAANSFGAVQGGVMAMVAEVAAAEALGSSLGVGGRAMVVTDLQVSYLALGRVGPIESRTTVFDGAAGAPPRSAVVEVFDTGADRRLTTVVTVGAIPFAGAATTAGSTVSGRG